MEKLATDASSLVARATAASGGRASDLGPRPRIAAGVGARRTGPGRELDPGNKNGFGTSKTLASKVWFTRGDGELTEVYSPDLGTPSARDLQFVVSDGSTFTENERDDATHETQLIDLRSLIYRQVNTARSGCWRITKTYVTDPGRSAVLVDVTFESLTGRPYQLYALYDPALSNTGDDDRGESVGDALGRSMLPPIAVALMSRRAGCPLAQGATCRI